MQVQQCVQQAMQWCRMTALAGAREGHLAIKESHVCDDGSPACQRPGLVKHDGADAVRSLQCIRSLTCTQESILLLSAASQYHVASDA